MASHTAHCSVSDSRLSCFTLCIDSVYSGLSFLIYCVAVVVECLKITLSKCVGYAIICAAMIGMYTDE